MLVETRADKARPNHLHLKHRAGEVKALSTVSKERDLKRNMQIASPTITERKDVQWRGHFRGPTAAGAQIASHDTALRTSLPGKSSRGCEKLGSDGDTGYKISPVGRVSDCTRTIRY